jgi:membrane-bound lytic murein transglycosylase B
LNVIEDRLSSAVSCAFSRRAFLTRILPAAAAAAALPFEVRAQTASMPFDAWRDAFRHRAAERGVSEATYRRTMDGVKPDTSVYSQIRDQPEFHEALWQYINRRVSDWRIITGKARARD